MENVDINTLKANPKNPRTISKHDYDSLLKSIKSFGDLSGIVFNRTTQQLVGGHQRIQAFKQLGGQPVIEERLDVPNSVGTVARGHVLLGDEKYSYREVDWVPEFETAANVAANRIQGEFDKDLLAELLYEINELDNGQELTDLMGLEADELSKLLGSVGGEEDEKYTKEIVTPNYEPTNEKPKLDQLVNHDKTNKLLAEIETSNIDESEKTFLRLAAYRHNVFDYSKIADYYAHSSPEVQNLMENSALVIIDYNKAVELGYVQLTKEMMTTQAEDYPDAE